jgi:hypothetical protein
MNRTLVFALLLCGAAVIAWRGTARASDRGPAARVICIETAGLALRLPRGEGAEGALHAVHGCRLPSPPAGLPGEHLLSALLDDGSALELRRASGDPAVIGRAAREALERAGFIETPPSALARDRAPGLTAAGFESADGRRRALAWVSGDGTDASPLLTVAVHPGGAP